MKVTTLKDEVKKIRKEADFILDKRDIVFLKSRGISPSNSEPEVSIFKIYQEIIHTPERIPPEQYTVIEHLSLHFEQMWAITKQPVDLKLSRFFHAVYLLLTSVQSKANYYKAKYSVAVPTAEEVQEQLTLALDSYVADAENATKLN